MLLEISNVFKLTKLLKKDTSLIPVFDKYKSVKLVLVDNSDKLLTGLSFKFKFVRLFKLITGPISDILFLDKSILLKLVNFSIPDKLEISEFLKSIDVIPFNVSVAIVIVLVPLSELIISFDKTFFTA